jgi:uncharacterized protein YegP (UPF0339 family)
MSSTVSGMVGDLLEETIGSLDFLASTHEDEDPVPGIVRPEERWSARMPGKFVIKKDRAGKFRFNLVASNGQVLVSSEAYESKASALNGIESVKTQRRERHPRRPNGLTAAAAVASRAIRSRSAGHTYRKGHRGVIGDRSAGVAGSSPGQDTQNIANNR